MERYRRPSRETKEDHGCRRLAKDPGEWIVMKAARFVDGRLSLVEEPVPQIKSGEVLINVKAAAICGSDQCCSLP
jgi:hypothetical protein